MHLILKMYTYIYEIDTLGLHILMKGWHKSPSVIRLTRANFLKEMKKCIQPEEVTIIITITITFIIFIIIITKKIDKVRISCKCCIIKM